MRLALGAVAGVVWSCGAVGYWLFPAVLNHLATGPLPAAALTALAAWTYGGAYLALFAAVYSWLPRPGWLTAPAAWVLLEQLRARVLLGAPWVLLGHTQHALLPLAQLAELTGVSGLSFLVLVPAAALAARGAERRAGLVAALVATVAVAIFGTLRLRALPLEPTPGAPPLITVVGGRNLDPDPLASYLAATALAAPAPLTVWPEGAEPGYLQDDPDAVRRIGLAARRRGWLLLGGPRHAGRGESRRYFNAAWLVDPDGRLAATYDKRRLVPGGERPPLAWLPGVARPFAPGGDAAPLDAGGARLGPLICWEAVFPDLARRYAQQGVDVLVNLTSDRNLGAGALQLLAFSRFRAIETRRWLVRASGTGPTYLIGPSGRIHQGTSLGREPPAAGETFYVRHGEVVAWASAGGLVLAGLAGARRKRRTGG